MKAATLLIILLSHDGYVLSGDDARITMTWALSEKAPEAEVVWDLAAAGVRVTGGRTALDPRNGATLTVRAPAVRVRTPLTFSYRLVRKGRDEPPIETGRATLHVFPRDLPDGIATAIGDRRLIVVDREAGTLSAALKQTDLTFDVVRDVTALQGRNPHLVMVAPDVLTRSPFAQAPLTALARGGCGVFVFQQTAPDHLAEYPVARRQPVAAMEVASEHPLLRGLERADIATWFAPHGAAAAAADSALPAVQLPPDEAAWEIIFWPREAPGGEKPAPIDALLLSKSVGDGRLVLCQLPPGDFQSDPRSRLLLRNALEYMVTRPEPTPPPSQRAAAPAPSPSTSQPTITIPSGARP